MKKYISPLLLIVLFTLSGCDLSDKVEREVDRIGDQIDEEINRLKNKYEEYSTDGDTRGEKPFTVIYQNENAPKSPVISSQCTQNDIPQHVYFSTQVDAQQNIFSAIANLYSYPNTGVLKPYWDTRYINPVSQYITGVEALHFPEHAKLTGLDARVGVSNITTGTGFSQADSAGSVIQSKCVNGAIATGNTLNLFDAPEQALTYAGIQSTFIYQIHPDNHTSPWNTNGDGNFMIQASFDLPIYNNFEDNIGASVSFNVFLYNPTINKHLNYVIGVYASGDAWQKEKAGIRYDPTTNIIHVATVIKDESWWATKSPQSKGIQEVYNVPEKVTGDDGQWNDFYRANIAHQNLLAVLNELKTNPPAEVAGQDFGLAPQDWEVTLVAVQYELEEQGGKASFSGSFRGFEAYISSLPL